MVAILPQPQYVNDFEYILADHITFSHLISQDIVALLKNAIDTDICEIPVEIVALFQTFCLKEMHLKMLFGLSSNIYSGGIVLSSFHISTFRHLTAITLSNAKLQPGAPFKKIINTK